MKMLIIKVAVSNYNFRLSNTLFVRWAMSRRHAKDWGESQRCLTTSSTAISRCPCHVTPLYSGHCCQVIIIAQ